MSIANRNLPPNWEEAYDPDCKRVYYVDHIKRETTWLNPLESSSRPRSAAECRGDELPYGWERIEDPICGTYFCNHIERKNQWTNPVSDWRRRMSIANKHHYSNSHHTLSVGHSNCGNSPQGPSTAPPCKIDYMPVTQTTARSDLNQPTASSNNSYTYDSGKTNGSANLIYTNTSLSSKFDANFLDIMDNRFGRLSGESIEV